MRLKRLELWWRAVWIRILVRLMRRSYDDRPRWDSRPFRILFLRHDRAGDMIVSTGVMRAIARSHPTITLDVLASPANASIVHDTDYIDQIIVFDKRRLSSYLPTAIRLRRAHYDAVVDCMVTAPSVTTLLLILASGARYRIGIAGRGNDAAFNITVPPETRAGAHMVDLLAPLAAAFDVDAANVERQPQLQISAAERTRADEVWATRLDGGRRALINVSAGTSERVWSAENYVGVMRHLRALDPGITLRVIGAPTEAQRAESIARDGGGEAAPTPSIRDALALVATADFVFTPDTSIAHAASAFRTPAVAIFVNDKAERWGLYGTSGENVQHPAPTMATLGVDRVIEAVDRVWNAAVLSRRV
ncbi:MAG TPA: glycosyltransferase family 9 protein [Gemmatimonadaceae bacterium]|nr:glycosyltransferase family 9 protein [Gemmatimonadaceae bacterium]